MTLFSMMAELEGNDEIHLGRILVLLNAFAGKDGTGSVEGLTKLAKLDFLLRYPVFLERAIEARIDKKPNLEIQDHERKSVESKMVRYRFGPWDYRYRRFLNILTAKGLVKTNIEGRKIVISLTPQGINIASQLSETTAFQDQVERAILLKRHFNMSATNLMNFIYQTFPEILSLKYGEDINIEH
ncbi:MAG: hypothetical protein BGO39_08885 [Chloroflexi bacterium 54-19]|nr:MAG: hypothetical protein BGO39_08885 [Chloroflexi bacterium 54-19]